MEVISVALHLVPYAIPDHVDDVESGGFEICRQSRAAALINMFLKAQLLSV